MLPFAIIFITAALIFYTIGVWAERIKKSLLVGHVVVFWVGFACDTAGTAFMSSIAAGGSGANPLHAVSGVIAIALMLVHAAWATVVTVKNSVSMKKNFHKFSLFVWIVWLVPYFSGMILGMGA